LQYESLIQEFCSFGHLNDVDFIARGGSFEYNDILFSWVHDPALDPHTVFLCVAYGPPPAEREATVYYELLRRNFLNFAGSGPQFTLSPVTGEVVLVERFDLRTATPEDLFRAVVYQRDAAADWRSTRFLEGPYMLRPAAPTSPRRPDSAPQAEREVA
jgi:hypothetical protein